MSSNINIKKKVNDKQVNETIIAFKVVVFDWEINETGIM